MTHLYIYLILALKTYEPQTFYDSYIRLQPSSKNL